MMIDESVNYEKVLTEPKHVEVACCLQRVNL